MKKVNVWSILVVFSFIILIALSNFIGEYRNHIIMFALGFHVLLFLISCFADDKDDNTSNNVVTFMALTFSVSLYFSLNHEQFYHVPTIIGVLYTILFFPLLFIDKEESKVKVASSMGIGETPKSRDVFNNELILETYEKEPFRFYRIVVINSEPKSEMELNKIEESYLKVFVDLKNRIKEDLSNNIKSIIIS